MLRGLYSRLWRYGIAFSTVAIALLLKLLLNPWSRQEETPFLLFFAAIIASTRYAGVGAGLLSVALSALLGSYFFQTPIYSLFSNNPWKNLQLAIFVVEGLSIVSLYVSLDTARRQTQTVTHKLQATEDQSQRHQELLHLIANSLPVCISYTDAQQRYRFTNKTYTDWFGFTFADVYGKHLVEVLGEAAYQVVKDKVERVLAGNLVEYEAEVPYKTGGTRYIQAINVPDITKDNQVRGYCALIIDISERKQAEAEIKQLNENLELRVKERTIQLEEINRELESFSYTVSHDLRAPLRAMHGLAQALQEDYDSQLDEIGQEYTRRIVAASTRLDKLIQDLLAYSRLGRSEIWLQQLSLDTVITQVLNELKPELQITQVQVSVEQPLPFVKAHRSILVQVLTNLIINAYKFVATGVQPRVKIWAEIREKDKGDGEGEFFHSFFPPTPDAPWRVSTIPTPHSPSKLVRLWIEDNGIGIGEQYQERIFQVFERLHGIETYPGTGIGLAIVKRGVERMGGRVGVESQLGEGSRFWIELPLGENC